MEKENRGFDLISRKPHPECPQIAVEVRFITELNKRPGLKRRCNSGLFAGASIPIFISKD